MMTEELFSKGYTKKGHILCIFEDGEETDMILHFRDDDLYDENGKTPMENIIGKLNEQHRKIQELGAENEQLRKQVAEYNMILRQHEFAEEEGFR